MSARVHEQIEIDAPAERVWELVMDPRRHGEWVPMHRSTRGLPEGELQPGDEFDQVLCLAGREFDMHWELLERDDPRRARWRAVGPGGAEANVTFEASGEKGRTRFDYVNEFEVPGGAFGRLAKRAAEMPARRQARKSLEQLKEAVERQV